jgi:hypothetical protein
MDAPRLDYSDLEADDDYDTALQAWKVRLYDWAFYVIRCDYLDVRETRRAVDRELSKTALARDRVTREDVEYC